MSHTYVAGTARFFYNSDLSGEVMVNDTANGEHACVPYEALREFVLAMEQRHRNVLFPAELLRDMEWAAGGGTWHEQQCPNCRAEKPAGHKPDCELDAAIRSAV